MKSRASSKGTNAYTNKEQNSVCEWYSRQRNWKNGWWWKVIIFVNVYCVCFRAELETVCEEYNIWARTATAPKWTKRIYRYVVPTSHGTQTTIGEGGTFENPMLNSVMSAISIRFMFQNNMAICLSGDIDYDKNDRASSINISVIIWTSRWRNEIPRRKNRSPKFRNAKYSGTKLLPWKWDIVCRGANTKEMPSQNSLPVCCSIQQAGLIDPPTWISSKNALGCCSLLHGMERIWCLHCAPIRGMVQAIEDLWKLLLEEIDKLRGKVNLMTGWLKRW